jgi:hypothetical protein
VNVPAEMPHDWDAHWRAAAREITDTVGGKARKTYAVDSALAIDVSRLGWAGRWPADPSWTAIFGQVLDDCDWGPLKGIILFRSPLLTPPARKPRSSSRSADAEVKWDLPREHHQPAPYQL